MEQLDEFMSGDTVLAGFSAGTMIVMAVVIAISAIAGFALSDRAFVGFAYDYQTTAIQQFSSGSYEMILRFTIPRKGERILTPRFF